VLRICIVIHKRHVLGWLLVLCLCGMGGMFVAGCSAMQRILPGGPTAQTVTDEIGALEMATRGTRIVVDTLQNLHLLSRKTVASIARVVGDSDTACNSARARLQAGDVRGAASLLHTAQAEVGNDTDIKNSLAQAEQLLNDPNVRAALRVIVIGRPLD
jgi:hypothetical protein